MDGLLNFFARIGQGIMNIFHPVTANAQSTYLSDREHNEEREDTAYQRGVADMRAAGLNPYTIGANPAPSSSSNANAGALGYQLQVLGSMLDIANLSIKNRKVTNDLIGDILGFFKK